MSSTTLTFRDVDGLAQAARSGLARETLTGTLFSVDAVGPLVELAALMASGQIPAWVYADHVDAGWGATVIRSFDAKTKPSMVRNGDRGGAFRLASQTEQVFMGFVLAARKAAETSGFTNNAAAQFGAAIRELRSNIIDHSLAAESGVLYFASDSGRFEFGVSDRGQGVLASLRTCDEYKHLNDHGAALRAAVTEGGSRYGSGTKHGYGFRPIFQGLAGYRGYLRWRSGDHAFVIDARNPASNLGIPTQKGLCAGLTLTVLCSAA